MTTNIVAALVVTMLQTNVVETHNGSGCDECAKTREKVGFITYFYHGPQCYESRRPVTEKRVTTTVCEVRKLVFGSGEFPMREFVLDSKVISTATEKFTRSEVWIADKAHVVVQPIGSNYVHNPWLPHIAKTNLLHLNNVPFAITTTP